MHFYRFVLERDLERVARLYRANGYYRAVVRAGRVRRMDNRKSDKPESIRVLVEIVVEDGRPTRVRRVELAWRDWSPATGDADAGAAATNAKSALRSGDIFTEEHYEKVRVAIQRELTNRGYAYARVEAQARVELSADQREDDVADVTYTIEIGPRCTFGQVTLEGLETIPEWQVRPALGFEEDDPYSTNKLEEAEVALADFNVFGSIEIRPQLSQSGPRLTKVPIRIVARPGALKSVRLGGGVEIGGNVATHGTAGWQHKNLFGALDRFNVEARPRLVFYPWKLATLFGSVPTLVPEVIGRLQYSLPFPYDPRTTVFVQGQGSAGLERNHDTPEAIKDDVDIPGEYIAEQRFGVERRFFLSRLLVGLAHNLSFSQPFSYNLDEPPAGKSALLLSYLQHYVEVDLRRDEKGRWDRVNPASGVLASVDVQLAGFFLGGDASDVKLRPEVRFFAPVAKRVVIAGRLSLGLLYTHDYGSVLDADIPTSVIAGDDALVAGANSDVQKLTKRGLFSGGPSSNRGYGFNEIAPHRVLDDKGGLLLDPDAIGGRTLWEASVELRFPIVGALGATVFIDASDVTRRLGEFRVDHPHVSSGFGIRYDTPVGPLRLDLGFRIPYLQVAGIDFAESCIKLQEPCETFVVDEGDASSFLGLPAALAIAIGNAY